MIKKTTVTVLTSDFFLTLEVGSCRAKLIIKQRERGVREGEREGGRQRERERERGEGEREKESGGEGKERERDSLVGWLVSLRPLQLLGYIANGSQHRASDDFTCCHTRDRAGRP